MSLLHDIQTAAVSGTEGLAPLLRRCKILAVRLGSTEFEQWVDQELNGYPEEAELPAYRQKEANSLGHFVGIAGSQSKNTPIPPSCVPERFRELVTQLHLREPVGSDDVTALRQAINSDQEAKAKGIGAAAADWIGSMIGKAGQGVLKLSVQTAGKILPELVRQYLGLPPGEA